MGKMDIQTKEYLADNRRFADIFNFKLYGGEQVLKPEQLRELDTTEVMVLHERMQRQRSRDLLKEVVLKVADGCCYALLGVENQAKIHLAMPVRNMTFDAMRYCKQITELTKQHREEQKENKTTDVEFLSGLREEDKLVPIITLTIYWSEKEWTGPRTLHEMLDIRDERLLSYIPDYHMNLIEPSKIEDFELFQSDIGAVLETIKVSENKEEMRRLFEEKEIFRHLDRDAAMLIKTCTGIDARLENEEEKVDMCKAWEDMKKESREEGRCELIVNALKQGRMVEEIAEFLGLSLEEVKQVEKEYLGQKL